MSPITTHVLDTTSGKPAEGVQVRCDIQQSDGEWREIGRGKTNADGRITDILPEATHLNVGVYRLTFVTGEYFRLMNRDTFYPKVTVEFVVKNGAHYHVPLLLSPFGYSTYRGS